VQEESLGVTWWMWIASGYLLGLVVGIWIGLSAMKAVYDD
jgi:hypothetical protein